MKIISFVNMKRGVGKTTTALNVADCLARVHNLKVAIIDVDPQFNATQCLFSGDAYVNLLKKGTDTILEVFDNSVASIASVVSGTETKKPKALKSLKLTKKGRVWILPGNIDLYRLEMQSGEGREFLLKRFIENAVATLGFDYVIIDTPPTPSIWMTSALIASDYYMIPVKPDPLSMIGIDLLRSIIDRRSSVYDLDIECLGVVFTMVERPDSRSYLTARKNLSGNARWKNKPFEPYLPKRASLARHQLERPYILDGDEYDLRNSLLRLVEEMIGRIDGA